MTTVKVFRRDKSIVCVECSGHAGYAEEGEDIICSALSSIVQTAALGLMQVAGINLDYLTDDREGYLKMILPDKLSDKQRHDADTILNTMYLGIADLHEGFSDFIELEVK